jgi:K+-sensing histidine kinase KdpD
VHARFRGRARATEHLVLPGGQRRTVVITSAAPVDELQVQVMRDETEVEASRRARDTILANISHEFRTPLSAQLASIELLLDQLPQLSVEQIEQLVHSQQRGTLRLTQLIDNLLESARIEAGQAAIRRQRVALDEVVEEALELTRPLHDQRRQTVIVDLPYPLPSVCGDAPRLTQVFVNLLGNAQKFAPDGSTIEIGGAMDATTITIWVADQGPGLPAMPDQGFFNRWVRSSQDEPEQGGAGLGLWLVKSIVERHGGHVEADSTAQGTRMSIVLPLEGDNENSDRRR